MLEIQKEAIGSMWDCPELRSISDSILDMGVKSIGKYSYFFDTDHGRHDDGNGFKVEEKDAERLVQVFGKCVEGVKDIDNMILMNILIRPSFFETNEQTLSRLPSAEKFFRDKGLSENARPIIFSLNKMQLFEVRAIIEEMQEELSSQHVCWELAGEIYLFQLLIMLLRIYNDPNYPNNTERNGAEKLIKYIEKNYAKKITMQDLIDNGNMSESTILRNFKRITGYPPFEYQMRQRMFASIQKLIYTDYDITQIAYAVGFNDSNYFSRCFKKFINMTPREYRMKYKSERASLPPEQDDGNTAGDEI